MTFDEPPTTLELSSEGFERGLTEAIESIKEMDHA